MATEKTPSVEARRYQAEQALANVKIEGFVPDRPFLDDYEQVTLGNMTHDEAIARVIERANAEEAAERTKGAHP